jgi:hypothetical protein
MSDENYEVEQRIKTIPWTKDSTWGVWSKQFLARAHIKGYKNILLGKDVVVSDKLLKSLDTKSDAGKEEARLRKLNDQAYHDLLLCFKDQVNFGLIEDAVTDDLADGDAAMAWKNLVHHHDPNTAANVVQLKSEFNSSKLKNPKKDPDEWISKLEVMRRKLKTMGHPISDMDMMIHVLNNLPKEYDNITDQLEIELDDKNTKLDMAIIRTRLRSKYNKLQRRHGTNKSTDESDDEEKEKALTATTKKVFKGMCSHCRKWGHKAANCRDRQNNGGNTNNNRNNRNNNNHNNNRGNNSNNNNNNNNNSDSSNQNQRRFDGECFYCGKKGHRANECRKKARDEANGSQNPQDGTGTERANTSTERNRETALCAQEVCSLASDRVPHLWIADSGASSHMINKLNGVTNIEDIDKEVIMGNGTVCRATKKGIYHGMVKQLDGTQTPVSFEVKYVPDIQTNLFSLTSAAENGAEVIIKDKMMFLKKNKCEIKFDRNNKAGDGYIMSVVIAPTSEEPDVALAACTLAAQTDITKNMIDINDLHKLLGHANIAKTKQTAAVMNLKVTGTFEECEACGLGKAIKKKISKSANKDSTKPMERIYVDLTTIQTTSFGNKKHWVLVVDEFTDMKWSFFLKQKSDLGKTMMNFLRQQKEEGFMVNKIRLKIRLDNAGENRAFKELCLRSDDFRSVKFEFTSPRTPQQNGVVERGLHTLMGRARSMMNAAGLSDNLRGKLWAECVNTATLLENAMPDKPNEKSPVEKYYGKQYKWINNLKEFGTMGVITTYEKTQPKLENRGTTAMFVGYSNDHPSDTYRFINIKTRKLLISRDVKWLGKTWGEYNNNTNNKTFINPTPDMFWNDDSSTGSINLNWGGNNSDDDVSMEDNQANDEMAIEIDNEDDRPRNKNRGGLSKVEREMKRLRTYYNPAIVEKMEEEKIEVESVENEDDENLPEVAAYAGAVESDWGEPKTFSDAWNHPNEYIRKKWREAIRKEIREMINKGVWRMVDRNKVPSGRKLIGNKWVFKVKKNGVYRARLVALGYSQVPGVDYTENFAPVINDITLRTLLVLMKVKNYSSRVIDVETAFLYGNLEEEIYMRIPSGLEDCVDEIPLNACLLLERSLYGLVQAARQWWKKIVGYLTKELNFKLSPVDPCLLYRKNSYGTVYLCLYVDDVLCVGDKRAIDEAIKDIKLRYTIKEIGTLKEYVGCTVMVRDEGVHVVQPDIIKKMENLFASKISQLSVYKTPAGPGEIVIRPKDGDTLIDENQQKLFRSGVGSLLYLMKHSRPDISNAVRELSKVMDGATNAHLKNLLRLIKFVSDTKNIGLILKPNMTNKWVITGKSDSDYAGDKDSRTSVSGYVVYLNGALIAWKSKSQKIVTLSSTEAEYMALCDLCTEVLFIKQLLENMDLKIELPIQLQVDNTGALFLAENSTTGQRTKHIDVRHHFIRNLIEDKIIEVKFVKTSDNDADAYTKNLSLELFEKHTKHYMAESPEID